MYNSGILGLLNLFSLVKCTEALRVGRVSTAEACGTNIRGGLVGPGDTGHPSRSTGVPCPKVVNMINYTRIVTKNIPPPNYYFLRRGARNKDNS